MPDEVRATESLIRWSQTTSHRTPRTPKVYPMTPEGDLAAWQDRLSAQIADDRAGVLRDRRKSSPWEPRRGAA